MMTVEAPGLGERLRGTQERLRGHARVVGAFAADQLVLDDRGLDPTVGRPARADLAGRPGPDHDEVELPFSHLV